MSHNNIIFPQNVLLRIFDHVPLRELVGLRLVNRMCKAFVDSKIQGPIDFIIDRAYLQSFKDSDACFVKARVIAGDIRRARKFLRQYEHFDVSINTLGILEQIRRIGVTYRDACILESGDHEEIPWDEVGAVTDDMFAEWGEAFIIFDIPGTYCQIQFTLILTTAVRKYELDLRCGHVFINYMQERMPFELGILTCGTARCNVESIESVHISIIVIDLEALRLGFLHEGSAFFPVHTLFLDDSRISYHGPLSTKIRSVFDEIRWVVTPT